LILTVHDIIPVLFPEYVKVADRLLYSYVYPQALLNADVIIAVSHNTKNDLLKKFNLNPDKIKVICNGCDHGVFRPLTDDDLVKKTCRQYGITDDYILCVASLSPRRNLLRLFKAFKKLITDHSDFKAFTLVIAGNVDFKYKNLFRYIKESNLTDNVHFIGQVKEGDLPAVYNGARLFVYPSLYEGFGLTVLEAMACGVPVISSDVSSIPEITGEAAVLIDPFSVDEIAETMYKVLTNVTLSESMKEKGISRAAEFTWEKTAHSTNNIYVQLS